MGNETRVTMIEGAIQLATRGVHRASLLKVLEHTGAARIRLPSLPRREGRTDPRGP